MYTQTDYSGTRQEQYETLSKQLDALLEGEPNRIANLSNASALLNEFLERINWVGFYLMEDGELVLGPFQGKTACVRIKVGKGVCGTAVAKNKTLLVQDVHAFPGHIACDPASRSEIVIPLEKDGDVIAVLDIDSPELSRFTHEDQEGLEQFAAVLMKHL